MTIPALRPSAQSDLPDAAGLQGSLQGVLDLVHLSRQTLGDRDLEVELLELFDRQAHSAMERLCDGAAVGGPARADLAHMLNGSARAVGAFGVAAAAGRLEAALRERRGVEVALDELAGAVSAARGAVAALLAA